MSALPPPSKKKRTGVILMWVTRRTRLLGFCQLSMIAASMVSLWESSGMVHLLIIARTSKRTPIVSRPQKKSIGQCSDPEISRDIPTYILSPTLGILWSLWSSGRKCHMPTTKIPQTLHFLPNNSNKRKQEYFSRLLPCPFLRSSLFKSPLLQKEPTRVLAYICRTWIFRRILCGHVKYRRSTVNGHVQQEISSSKSEYPCSQKKIRRKKKLYR